MNNPPAAPVLAPNRPNLPVIVTISDEDSSDGTWDSSGTSASEDSSDDEVEELPEDEGCADLGYWEEDAAADAWLAQFPGGEPLLYPRLLVIKPRAGKVMTAARSSNTADSLLRLPSEIRNRIYKHYFDGEEEERHPKEGYAPFRDREGVIMPRIRLTSTNEELKFWLSTSILQTSRQLRSEAMFILFSSRVITVEWLPAIPRFVEFLGKENCGMVRYLDIWESLNLAWEDKTEYRDLLASVACFSSLQHLRIVDGWGLGDLVGSNIVWNPRTISWFDKDEWKKEGILKEDAVPKMRFKDIETFWPEYEILKTLKAHNFTLATQVAAHALTADYLEFDRSYEAYAELCKSMRSKPALSWGASLSTTLARPSMSPQVREAFEAIDIHPHHINALTPNSDLSDRDSSSNTWQDAEIPANRTVPLYNFVREFFHENLPPRLPEVEMAVRAFFGFPTALKSTGSIMRDCAFCCMKQRHCGYHNVPDQLPFRPKPHDIEEYYVEEDLKILQAQFEDLSYVDLIKVCKDIVEWMLDVDNFASTRFAGDVQFLKFAAIFDYLGWPEVPNSERLARLDAAVETGWMGKRVGKDEVLVWDVLYREVRPRYSYRHSFLKRE